MCCASWHSTVQVLKHHGDRDPTHQLAQPMAKRLRDLKEVCAPEANCGKQTIESELF